MFDGCLKKSVSPGAPIGLALGCHEMSKLGVIGYLHAPIELYAEANYHHFWANIDFLFLRGLEWEFLEKNDIIRKTVFRRMYWAKVQQTERNTKQMRGCLLFQATEVFRKPSHLTQGDPESIILKFHVIAFWVKINVSGKSSIKLSLFFALLAKNSIQY